MSDELSAFAMQDIEIQISCDACDIEKMMPLKRICCIKNATEKSRLFQEYFKSLWIFMAITL